MALLGGVQHPQNAWKLWGSHHWVLAKRKPAMPAGQSSWSRTLLWNFHVFSGDFLTLSRILLSLLFNSRLSSCLPNNWLQTLDNSISKLLGGLRWETPLVTGKGIWVCREPCDAAALCPAPSTAFPTPAASVSHPFQQHHPKKAKFC